MNRLICRCIALSIFATSACGSKGAAEQPKAAVLPIEIGGDLTTVDVCRAIPQENIEAVMGRKLVTPPTRFEYYDTAGTSGCSYDAGKDSSGEAHFGYVVLTPIDVYRNQPLYKNAAVNGIGESAYFNNGADARQLWVKVNAHVAFVVAFGDRPNEAGATAIAKLIVTAIK